MTQINQTANNAISSVRILQLLQSDDEDDEDGLMELRRRDFLRNMV